MLRGIREDLSHFVRLWREAAFQEVDSSEATFQEANFGKAMLHSRDRKAEIMVFRTHLHYIYFTSLGILVFLLIALLVLVRRKGTDSCGVKIVR